MTRLIARFALAVLCLGSPLAMSTADGQVAADPARPAPAAAAYQIVPYSHNSAIMIDVRSGQSWKLERDPEGEVGFVWVPIRKLSTNMEIDQWHQRTKKLRAERRKRRMDELRGLDGFPPAPEIPPALGDVPDVRIEPFSPLEP